MAKYNIEIKRSAVKEIERLPNKDLRGVLKRIEELSEDPRPKDCKKLSGEEKYRIRCGDYRILYMVYDREILVVVVGVGHRREVYR